MHNELDSSCIIAALIEYSDDIKEINLSYHHIREVACRLERLKPTLLVTCDMLSIDAFRCSFSQNVVMETNQLVISDFGMIRCQLKKMLPSKDITDIIQNIEKEYRLQ